VRQIGVIDLSQPVKAAAAEAVEGAEEKAEVVMDEEELDTYILNSEEQQKRSLIWEKQFRSFLDDRERRQKDRELANAVSEEDMYTQGGKMKKKYAKRLKKAAAAAGGGDAMSAAQAAMQYVGQMAKPSSRKINYEALKGVFNDDGSFAAPDPTASTNASVTSSSGLGLGLAKLKSLGVKTAISSSSSSSSSSSVAVAVKTNPATIATKTAVTAVEDEVYEEYEEDDEVVGHTAGADNDYEYYDDDEYY